MGLARVACAAALVIACDSAVPSPTPAPVVAPSAVPSPTTTGSPIAAVSSPPDSASPSPSATPTLPVYALSNCQPTLNKGWSVARLWDETALDLIRQNPPAPTVVARNLFDMSAVMWDAWAAYDPKANGYFFTEKQAADDVTPARNAAISYAAYHLLLDRYFQGQSDPDGPLAAVMRQLCYRFDYSRTDATPAGVGFRIGLAAIRAGQDDGSNEAGGYVDSSYRPVNPALKVARPSTTMNDPNKWQPLEFPRGQAQGQGGRPAPDIQTFIGAQWGFVSPFALPTSTNGVAIDPGPPPALGKDQTLDEEYKQAAIDLLRLSSTLDPRDGVMEDISPGSLGNSTLGADDGHGRAVNPDSGQPYQPDVVVRADYERSLAEFWADGPNSETPPGHWNLIANTVSDSPGFGFRFGGGAPIGDRLEWDVKMYFALNGALHDAAIAAWGLKRYYDSARPISMIRYMSQLGQSSDPSQPHYNPEGMPLVDGVTALITKEDSAKGQPLYELRDHLGEIAVHAWRGFPEDPATQTSGVGWILGVDWVPYQRPTFVTPSFPGYISGHSTFSRAAAEVLAGMTGTEYFPGGLYEWKVPPDSLKHELGPTDWVAFEWATYYDAADAAGISRRYMGIHLSQDDYEGRKIGSQVGLGAWALAQRYFDGSAKAPTG